MIIRTLAALVLAFCAVPVAAQDGDEGGLRGFWRGTVGDMPVYACFGGGDERGVYYYDQHRQLIRLLNEEGVFSEAVGWRDPGDASWVFSDIEGGMATGEWREGERRLPISLQRQEWSSRDGFGGPCESAQFNQLRFEGGSVDAYPAMLGEQAYTALRYIPPEHWRVENNEDIYPIDILSFALPEENYGDRAINHALAYYLPRGEVGDAFAQCMAGNIASHGVDGDFHQNAAPELIAERWLGLVESNSVYCGGAHPSHWLSRRVFDRINGVEVDPETWLNDSALNRRLLASGTDTSVYATIADDFMPVLLHHWEAPDADKGLEHQAHHTACVSQAASVASWDMGLASDGNGMAFIPRMPHVLTSCAETVNVPWSALEPFLTLEGQAVMLSLRDS